MVDQQDPVLSDIKKKIERERNIAFGAANLKKKTNNAGVIQKCNTSIREAQQNIEYLEQTLNKLTLQKEQERNEAMYQQQSQNASNTGQHYSDHSDQAYNTNNHSQPLSQHQLTYQAQRSQDQFSSTNTAIHGRHLQNVRSNSPTHEMMRSSTPIAHNKTNFTRLELSKYDCPSLGHRIQSMLQQLEFRIQVEQQYLEANEKISKLYQLDGDRQSTNKAESGRIESAQKIALLKRALKRYQAMHIDVVEVTKDTEVLNTPTARKKTLSGTLTIGLTTVRDVDHIASPTFSRKPECYISLKVDGIEVARTKGSRNDRWNEEFHIKVDKGNELEINVYDKQGSQYIPVAVTWFLISDIAEEIRKKKLDTETMNAGWISASKLQQASMNNDTRFISDSPTRGNKGNADLATLTNNDHSAASSSTPNQANTSADEPIVSNAWFILEPAGQVLVTLGFTKTEQHKRDFVSGLGRHGAIRQRKEEVHEQHGHKFVQKQFYNVMCCALCGDFLRYTGYQCQDCKLLCHKKCYQKIVTKCISKSSSEIDPDEAKLNHRIPHRFEPVSNRGTKWCCHCGYILPWSKKTVRKCTECGTMCHSHCIHLVPDFCGMSLEMANTILTTIKSTKGTNYAQHAIESPRRDSSSAATLVNDQASSNNNLPPLPSYQQHQHQQFQHQHAPMRFPTMDPYAKQAKQLPPVPPKESSYYADHSKTTTPIDMKFGRELPESANMIEAEAGEEDEDHESSYMDHSQVGANAADQYIDHQYRQQQHQQQQQQAAPLATRDQDALDNIIDQNPFGGKTYPSQPKPETAQPEESQEQSYPEPVMSQDLPRQQSAQVVAQQQQPTSHHQHHASHSRQYSQDSKKVQHRRRRKLGLDDFQFLAVLGAGNFGKVMLAESRHTSKLCAIKVLKKDFIIESDEIASTRSEKRVFLVANKERHPFLLNLHCCFQTENRVYFVMEYISGGDLMHHVQCERFTEERAQFYAAEILLGLKYLHDNGVIYRDLKLDNILLTVEGHIKLADYGLCKEGMWYGKATSTFCGTPEFMAPEILDEQGYGRAVDWWAFGVLLYQMLCNRSPFNGEDEDDTFASIQNDEARYPLSMKRDAVYLLQGLLTKDPAQRLGGSERDALEIMEHSYFANINFDDVLNLRVDPPFVPEIKSARDLSNFDREFTSETPRLTPVNSVLDASQQEQFRGFSYTSGDEVV